MPDFSNTPPSDQTSHAYDIVRCPAAGKLRAVITCPDLVGCPTHFYRGHTVPCQAPLCEACDEALPWRWHGYVTIFTAKTHFHQLLELTAPAVKPLLDFREEHATLRGAIIEVHRISPRPNGRVRIVCTKADMTVIQIPTPPDLRLILATLWNLPELTQEIRGTQKGFPQYQAQAQETLPNDRGPNRIDELVQRIRDTQLGRGNGELSV